MNTWVGQSFVLTTVGAISVALGCSEDLVANEGDANGGGGSGGTPAAGSVVTGFIVGPELPDHCLPPDWGEGTRWAGSPLECPAELPGQDACDGPDDAPCVYLREDSRPIMCACLYDRDARETRWLCEDFAGPSPGCPELPPEDGASCFGARATTCEYPFPETTACECEDTDDPLWSCDPEANLDTLPPSPEGVDPKTTVAELTDAERNEVCAWVELRRNGGVGFAPRDGADVGPDGFTQNNGCGFRREFSDTFVWPTVSQAQCAANLALSSCDAPVSELADCVVAMIEGSVARAKSCGLYLGRSLCNGTMFWAVNDCDEAVGSQDCSLQVE